MKEDIEKALEVLRNGGTIVYPTETIWGIGCDATRQEAVEKVYRIKKRMDSKSMLILVEDQDRLADHLEEIPETAYHILQHTDQPVTIIFPGGRNLAPGLLAEDGSIGIRIVKHEFCQRLIRQLDRPLVSTSANFAGLPAPARFKDIDSRILDQADYVVRYQQDKKNPGKASGIIKIFKDQSIQIIRK